MYIRARSSRYTYFACAFGLILSSGLQIADLSFEPPYRFRNRLTLQLNRPVDMTGDVSMSDALVRSVSTVSLSLEDMIAGSHSTLLPRRTASETRVLFAPFPLVLLFETRVLSKLPH